LPVINYRLKKAASILFRSTIEAIKPLQEALKRLKQKFLEYLPEQDLFVEKLKAQKRINAANQLQQILSLSKLYSRDDFAEALKAALDYNVFSSFVHRRLP